jgi:hypothetical protein
MYSGVFKLTRSCEHRISGKRHDSYPGSGSQPAPSRRAHTLDRPPAWHGTSGRGRIGRRSRSGFYPTPARRNVDGPGSSVGRRNHRSSENPQDQPSRLRYRIVDVRVGRILQEGPARRCPELHHERPIESGPRRAGTGLPPASRLSRHGIGSLLEMAWPRTDRLLCGDSGTCRLSPGLDRSGTTRVHVARRSQKALPT